MKTDLLIRDARYWKKDNGKIYMWEKHVYCLHCFEDFIYRTLKEDKEPVACPFCGCRFDEVLENEQ